jgi:hypothetical protein
MSEKHTKGALENAFTPTGDTPRAAEPSEGWTRVLAERPGRRCKSDMESDICP